LAVDLGYVGVGTGPIFANLLRVFSFNSGQNGTAPATRRSPGDTLFFFLFGGQLAGQFVVFSGLLLGLGKERRVKLGGCFPLRSRYQFGKWQGEPCVGARKTLFILALRKPPAGLPAWPCSSAVELKGPGARFTGDAGRLCAGKGRGGGPCPFGGPRAKKGRAGPHRTFAI